MKTSKMTYDKLRVRSVLQDQIKKRKLTQKRVADDLNVSLATLKRWLARGDMPLSASLQILDLLQLSFADFESLLEYKSVRTRRLTFKQEQFLGTHPKCAYIFLLVFIGFGKNEILKQLHISESDYLRYLRQLVGADLIYLNARQTPIPLVSGPFQWSKEGSFSKAYAIKAFKVLVELLKKKIPALGLAENDPSIPFFRVYEMHLSRKNAALLGVHLNEVMEKFYEISRVGRESADAKDLLPVAGIVSAENFNLWKAVQWD